MTERKMATIRSIDGIKPIPDADRICAYQIGGWWIVDAIGAYNLCDLVVYCEIDSWIPTTIAPFLSKGKEPRMFEGISGERLRTVKLRKQISQGLILPLSVFSDADACQFFEVGQDVSEMLGIIKYEAPISAQLRGMVKGNFPSFIPKTDEERCISGDTLITTDIGNLTIKNIVDNKISCNVKSFNVENRKIEYKKIIDWSSLTRKNNWVKITLKSGKHLICTENHKIWCEDISAYREAKYIMVGQLFITKRD
jgi:hypothetical protein